MPFPLFDRSALKLEPLGERIHDVHAADFPPPGAQYPEFDHPAIAPLAEALAGAKIRRASSILMYGGHVVRSGCAPHMIKMMRSGLVTHFATNGAGSIHDFELSLIGHTCESVAKYVSEGRFGLWRETGILNDILREGVRDGLGAGEAIGRYIWESHLPGRESSVLAAGYRHRVPCTVHIGIGNDIIHEHPNCDGAALGAASYTDFLIYTQSVSGLEGGVFLNFGSAVTGPEVYLKALAMARNVAHQEGRFIRRFTTAVFDLLSIVGEDHSAAPPKDDPRYYFRPWKTILARTVADGGVSYYIQGEHRLTMPRLARAAMDAAHV